jgi:hypothetical protein
MVPGKNASMKLKDSDAARLNMVSWSISLAKNAIT